MSHDRVLLFLCRRTPRYFDGAAIFERTVMSPGQVLPSISKSVRQHPQRVEPPPVPEALPRSAFSDLDEFDAYKEKRSKILQAWRDYRKPVRHRPGRARPARERAQQLRREQREAEDAQWHCDVAASCCIKPTFASLEPSPPFVFWTCILLENGMESSG